MALLSFKLKEKRRNFIQTQCSELKPFGPTLIVTIVFASHYPPHEERKNLNLKVKFPVVVCGILWVVVVLGALINRA